MIRVRQVKVNIENDSINNIKIQTAKKLNIKPSDILNIKINNKRRGLPLLLLFTHLNQHNPLL